ncbi:MAG: energy transducer TonB [Acidobacteria bacterium]|nr:energy transducer TonB [Acidobacteriota bacterium]
MKKQTLATVMLATCLAAPVGAQDSPLAAARELYASARYDEALAMLNGLRPAEPSNLNEVKSIEQYRSLCLLALGRGTEAESAIAAVVTVDPLYQPNDTDASPRVRAAFTEVRQRLLPGIAGLKYAAAKAAFDRKEFASAEQQFRHVIALIDDPQMGGRLGDMRVLAAGFLELSAAGAAPPPPPETKPAEPAPQPVAPPAAPSPPRIYVAEDPGVTPPLAIKQEFPRVPSGVMAQVRERGLLEIIVDERGRAAALTVRTSLHPVYDTLLMAAAREWRYQPATYEGRPVKFRKLIQVTLSKR